MTDLAARCARWSSTHWKTAVGGWLALVLLPAAMALLGEWNWYLPRWLGWLPGMARERELPRQIAEPAEPVPEPAGRL